VNIFQKTKIKRLFLINQASQSCKGRNTSFITCRTISSFWRVEHLETNCKCSLVVTSFCSYL